MTGALVLLAALSSAPDSEPKPRVMAFRIAQCFVKRSPASARDVVLRNFGNAETFRRLSAALGADCGWDDDIPYSIRVALPQPMMQYALASALLASDPTAVVTDVKSVPPLRHWDLLSMLRSINKVKTWTVKEQEALEKSRQQAISLVAVDYFGECVVRADPETSGALVRSAVDSSVEAAAFQKLKPALASCIPAGKKLSLSSEVVRGTVAYNYYRIAKASMFPEVTAAK